MKGNYPMTRNSSYSQGTFYDANAFVKSYGNMPFSRPIMAKLYGTVRLPYDFMFSFIFIHTDGPPWGRTVSVQPPEAWAAAHNARTWTESIYVEPPGTRWDQPYDNLDLRVEKDFALGPGKLGVYMDVFNLLGAYTISAVKNPAGTWIPTDANTTAETYAPGFVGLTGVTGTRIIKFSLLYKF